MSVSSGYIVSFKDLEVRTDIYIICLYICIDMSVSSGYIVSFKGLEVRTDIYIYLYIYI